MSRKSTTKTIDPTIDNGVQCADEPPHMRAHLEALETKEPKLVQQIELPKLDIRTIVVRIVGDSPLIVHNWSKKAKRQMLDKQMGKATVGRENKDPEQDFLETLYPLPGETLELVHSGGIVSAKGRTGVPSLAFKNCGVTACTSLGKAITKVCARQAFHVMGELVEIYGTPVMREDMVRVGMGTADIRFRGEYNPWSCDVKIRYNARVLKDEQVVNLLNTAGFAVGICEWRSECDGSYGAFHVE